MWTPQISRATAPARSTDRKSTRLNSSHVEISYAVFCLKKKKKTPYTYTVTHTSSETSIATPERLIVTYISSLNYTNPAYITMTHVSMQTQTASTALPFT